MWIGRVAIVRVVDESAHVAPTPDGADVGQCSGRTTRLNKVMWRSRMNAIRSFVQD